MIAWKKIVLVQLKPHLYFNFLNYFGKAKTVPWLSGARSIMNRSMSSVIKDDHSYHRPTTPFPRFRFFGFVHDGLLRSQWSLVRKFLLSPQFLYFFYYLCEKKKFSSCKVVLPPLFCLDPIIRWWEHSQLIDHSYRILHRCASCQVLRDFPLEFRWQEVNPCRCSQSWYVRPCGFFLKKKTNQAIWRRNTKLLL